MSTVDHARAIEQMIDKCLSSSGSGPITVDRATLKQMREHASAIEGGSSKH